MTPKAVTAAILMLGLAGAASAAELNARNPIQLAEYLRDKGYRAQLGTDSYGDPKIDTATAGANYTIYFYGCSNNTDCQDLQLRAGFDLTGELSLESVNSWNREKTVGRVKPRCAIFWISSTGERAQGQRMPLAFPRSAAARKEKGRHGLTGRPLAILEAKDLGVVASRCDGGGLDHRRGQFLVAGQRIVLTLHRAFEMRAAFDRDGLMNDVTLDAGGRGQADLEATHAAHNAAIDHHVIGNHFALYGGAFPDGQQVGTNVTLDSAFDLYVAGGLDVADDVQIRGQHRSRGLGLGRGGLEIGLRTRGGVGACGLGRRSVGFGSGLVDFALRKHR